MYVISENKLCLNSDRDKILIQSILYKSTMMKPNAKARYQGPTPKAHQHRYYHSYL